MKIAIISDIHDNLTNLKKCLDWCKENNVKKLICCGDITNEETLDFLSKNFKGKIYLVRGNMEIYAEEALEKFSNIDYLGRTGVVKIENFSIGVCHEPYLINKILSKNDCDLIFYGHTHKPWIETKKKTKIINPGTLGGVFEKATFAVWLPGTGELILNRLEEIK